MAAVFFILMIYFPLAGRADEITQSFDQGSRLYLQGKFTEAAALYENILKNGYESGELYFNLGNAYYKEGNVQKAILQYERARRFIPNDEDLQFNLQLANLQVIDKIETVPQLFVYRWMDELLSLFPLSTLGWILYSMFLFVLVSFALYLFLPTLRQKRASMFAGIVSLTLLLITGFLFTGQSYKETNTQYAIVMGDIVNIKSAPDAKGNDVFVLHRGLKVQLLDEVNHWRKIRLADGKVGWIPEAECEVI
jgi:tetratricopeptide (TPR) repeat protein